MRDPEMVGLARLAAVPQYIREHVEQVVFRIARRAILSMISPTGDDQAENYQTAPTDPQGQVAARKFQHYGFRSAPPVRSEIIALSLGAKISNRVYVASEAPGVGPQAQTEGEVEVYTKFGHRIALQQDGSVLIEAASGGTMTLHENRLTVSQDIARDHDLGVGGTPVCVPDPALLALANASTAFITGTDRMFRVTLIVAGANPATAGTALFDVTFARAYTNGAMGVVSLESGDKKFSYAVTNSTVKITSGDTVAPGTTLVFDVVTGGLV